MTKELTGTVGDRYRILRRLGAGGMGSVYEVRDEKTGGLRALKTLLPEFGTNPDMLRRFQSEVDVLKRIHHEAVIEILDVGFDPEHGFPFLVMELLDGESLEELIRKRAPLDSTHAVKILSRVATALDVIHEQNVVHRDLKPPNVFIRRRDGLAEVKLLDFGIAKLVGTSSGKVTAVIGTPGYMSPEQFDGQGIDRRTDIYALGKLAREMLFGPALSEGFQHTGAARRDPSGALEAWFAKATHWDKRQRFNRASEAIQALAVVLGVPRRASSHIEWGELYATTARGVVRDSERPNPEKRGTLRRFQLPLSAGLGALVLFGAVWLARRDGTLNAAPAVPEPVAATAEGPPGQQVSALTSNTSEMRPRIQIAPAAADAGARSEASLPAPKRAETSTAQADKPQPKAPRVTAAPRAPQRERLPTRGAPASTTSAPPAPPRAAPANPSGKGRASDEW